ncbi:XrtA system polysaccharide deacetylase [Plasticicumulans acidivorans]|uniref:Polysaccharide deacetylase family protein (PEP-CTERM system associated) n=1 Tax=Plasticicumulans acidivorans TaxID=886464 RepID=A0A317MZW8_9GAMM|nr:XrtA system polysaccharide deacetylase [Plasticicumulans acidivorans]PWV65726.1 polysaccharide deacetylase family protein (PEP-CTERM system associated) [Plasticicumulans acidivorans]
MSAGPLTNAMTVDVEDYFQVSALAPYIPRAEWDAIPRRVGVNTHRVLDLFAGAGVHATFFVLGWIAERHPDVVRRIVAEGHELASHGYEHVRVIHQSPEQFREDIRRTKALLEDLGGVGVRGYRAASYSIGASNLWALEELQAAGYVYSSSIFPGKHDLYGMPDAPRFRFTPENAPELTEIPITTVDLFGRRLPAAGGGFFRLFPYAVSRWLLSRVNQQDGQAGLFYFHPWEIDPRQPRQHGIDLRTRIRHYLNLERTESRLKHLLRDFRWDRMDRVFRIGEAV